MSVFASRRKGSAFDQQDDGRFQRARRLRVGAVGIGRRHDEGVGRLLQDPEMVDLVTAVVGDDLRRKPDSGRTLQMVGV